jgi:quinol-cytochrome oxidoreductase complex cytochrome b subunit
MRALLVLTGASAVVLVASGLWLAVGYRPTTAAGNPFAPQAQMTDWFRFAHRYSTLALMALALCWLLVAARGVSHGRRGAVGLAAALVTLALLAGGWVSGWLLPWDQLALWAVTAGNDLYGYRLLTSDQVRFVLVARHEVGTDYLRRVFLVHAVAIPIVLLAGPGAAIAVRWRRRSADRSRRTTA